LGKGKKS